MGVTDSLPTDQYLDLTSQSCVKSLEKCKTMVSKKDCSRNWKMNIANSPLCLGNGFSLISPVSQLDIGYTPNNTNQATLPGKFLKKSELCVNSAIGSEGRFAIRD